MNRFFAGADRFQQCSRRGFTLVEVMSAVAVLFLLFVLLIQFVGESSSVIGSVGKNVDADEQARYIFSRMTEDFAGLLARPDADSEPYDFTGQTGNEALFFYSQAPAYYDPQNTSLFPTGYTPDPKNPVSLVGYRVAADPARANFFQLQRLGKGLTWDKNSVTPSGPGTVVLMTYPYVNASMTSNAATNPGGMATVWATSIGSAPGFTNGVDANAYHVIGDEVFRLSYCFLLKSGGYSLKRDPTQGFTDVSAVVVAIALLDNKSRLQISSMTSLVNALPNPTATNLATSGSSGPDLMDVIWQQAINASGFATTAGVPAGVASHIRVYQRYFYLNTSTSL